MNESGINEFEVRLAMQGDTESMQRLWRDHRRWVAAIILAHKPREVELEDLLQEVALSMVQRMSELRDPAKFRPWLRAVAVNASRTAGRRATTRRVVRSLRLTDNEIPDTSNAAGQVSEAQRVLQLAQRLHPDYREPLLLRAVRGLSQKQIAETLGLPETTIETRLARARRMLREEVQFEAEADTLSISSGGTAS
jgi:RNA polymerase sigma-70 factor (ECF subfamily)